MMVKTGVDKCNYFIKDLLAEHFWHSLTCPVASTGDYLRSPILPTVPWLLDSKKFIQNKSLDFCNSNKSFILKLSQNSVNCVHRTSCL